MERRRTLQQPQTFGPWPWVAFRASPVALFFLPDPLMLPPLLLVLPWMPLLPMTLPCVRPSP